MPDGAVYVGRPTRWGNPWTGTTSGDKPGMSPAEAVERYRRHLADHPELITAARGWPKSRACHPARHDLPRGAQRLEVGHCGGGDEPLLGVADIVAGRSARTGKVTADAAMSWVPESPRRRGHR